MRSLALVLIALSFACTDEATPSGGDAATGRDAVVQADAAARDADPADAIAQADAANMDAENADAENADAENADAENADAENADAVVVADAGFDCGTIGVACGPNAPCINQLMCADPANVCTPEAPPMCGGFANQQCPNPATQICLYYQSTDYGACFTQEVRDCICTTPAGMNGFVC